MRSIDVIKILGEMGGRFPKSQIEKIVNYFTKMMDDSRVILITEHGRPHAVMTFSIGNDYEKFYKKGTWDYVEHDPNGFLIYVELIVCRQWDRVLRIEFQNEILKRFPKIEEGHWHRWASWGDRHVKWRRKINV